MSLKSISEITKGKGANAASVSFCGSRIALQQAVKCV